MSFKALGKFITNNIIIEREKVYYLTGLLVKYKQLFVELGNGEFIEEDIKNYKVDLQQCENS